jgi:hypothetical protein
MLECAARHLDQDTTLLSALARDIQLRMGKAIDHALLRTQGTARVLRDT